MIKGEGKSIIGVDLSDSKCFQTILQIYLELWQLCTVLYTQRLPFQKRITLQKLIKNRYHDIIRHLSIIPGWNSLRTVASITQFPKCMKCFRESAFSVAGRRHWNSLQRHVIDITNQQVLKRALSKYELHDDDRITMTLLRNYHFIKFERRIKLNVSKFALRVTALLYPVASFRVFTYAYICVHFFRPTSQNREWILFRGDIRQRSVE